MTQQSALELTDQVLPDWTSPSKVLADTINPGDRLLRWAWKAGQRGVLLDQASAPEREAGKAAHAVLETYAHAQLEGAPWLPIPPRSFEPLPARGQVQAINDWWRDRLPRVIACEASCSRNDLRLRGRVDLVIACRGCDTCGPVNNPENRPGRIIVDAKANGLGRAKAHLQVGGFYPLLWKAREPGAIVCRSMLLGLDQDGQGSWVELDCQAAEVDALAALDHHRRLTRITGLAHAKAGAAGARVWTTPEL